MRPWEELPGGLEYIRWPGVEREMDIARSACSLMDGAEAQRSREKGTSQPTGGSSQEDGVAKDRSRPD